MATPRPRRAKSIINPIELERARRASSMPERASVSSRATPSIRLVSETMRPSPARSESLTEALRASRPPGGDSTPSTSEAVVRRRAERGGRSVEHDGQVAFAFGDEIDRLLRAHDLHVEGDRRMLHPEFGDRLGHQAARRAFDDGDRNRSAPRAAEIADLAAGARRARQGWCAHDRAATRLRSSARAADEHDRTKASRNPFRCPSIRLTEDGATFSACDARRIEPSRATSVKYWIRGAISPGRRYGSHSGGLQQRGNRHFRQKHTAFAPLTDNPECPAWCGSRATYGKGAPSA